MAMTSVSQAVHGVGTTTWQASRSTFWYCRRNCRTYRLTPTKDKRWNLHRVTAVSDEEKGSLVGTYGGRADATKVIATAAYQPEPRWQGAVAPTFEPHLRKELANS